MKNKYTLFCLILVIGLCFPFPGTAQSGGDFTITKLRIGAGGGESSGGDFSVTTANGQPAVGTRMINPPFNIGTGFFPPPALAPSAADAMIRGRVVSGKNRGIRNAVLSLTGGAITTPRIVRTNQFGYFIFNNVGVGQVYIVSVWHKRYGFGQNTQTITLFENVNDIIFRADWENY